MLVLTFGMSIGPAADGSTVPPGYDDPRSMWMLNLTRHGVAAAPASSW